MRFVLFGTWVLLVLARLSWCQNRVCSLSDLIPFTGYKIEAQIRGKTVNYDLVLCKDNKVIFDTVFNNTIPWTKELNFGGNPVVIARRKTFSQRVIPLFFPRTWVGAIYPGKKKPIPLVAENILQHWVEVNYLGEVTYHVPLLSTPRIDSTQNRYSGGWDRYLLSSENYTTNYDSRSKLRQKIDSTLLKVDKILREEDKEKRLEYLRNLSWYSSENQDEYL